MNSYVPQKCKGIEPCTYCGYSIGRNELCITVERWFYHIECAEKQPNIKIDWDTFNWKVETGQIKL